jgi:hypothetical protein
MLKRHFIATIILVLTVSSCNSNYLDYYQHIESPNGQFYYGLYSDFSVGDPGFLVLKLDKKTNPKDLKINYSINGIKEKDAQWIQDRTLLSNYDEVGLFTSNPKIEIINNRHLVFSRGGLYFGLYDLKISKDTFNITSPWNAWLEKSGYKSEKYDRNEEQKAYGKWIKQNLDAKIRNYIATNK